MSFAVANGRFVDSALKWPLKLAIRVGNGPICGPESSWFVAKCGD
jgi:hypothetical protein